MQHTIYNGCYRATICWPSPPIHLFDPHQKNVDTVRLPPQFVSIVHPSIVTPKCEQYIEYVKLKMTELVHVERNVLTLFDLKKNA